ncbi:hypothetical protein BLNAU_9941 [Blattamonas nauphoetae]|uniref:Transmembrane protein n=1 Tax=Blattamonas nauphoetae TaxID=2049346 RepID=A0ABQ9XU64_9EUKA|nr:hypothetical protein BLNAU_9941 [Blattamonas nauphoetae]
MEPCPPFHQPQTQPARSLSPSLSSLFTLNTLPYLHPLLSTRTLLILLPLHLQRHTRVLFHHSLQHTRINTSPLLHSRLPSHPTHGASEGDDVVSRRVGCRRDDTTSCEVGCVGVRAVCACRGVGLCCFRSSQPTAISTFPRVRLALALGRVTGQLVISCSVVGESDQKRCRVSSVVVVTGGETSVRGVVHFLLFASSPSLFVFSLFFLLSRTPFRRGSFLIVQQTATPSASAALRCLLLASFGHH